MVRWVARPWLAAGVLALFGAACSSGTGVTPPLGDDGSTSTRPVGARDAGRDAGKDGRCSFEGAPDRVIERESEGGPALLVGVSVDVQDPRCAERVHFAMEDLPAGTVVGYHVAFSSGGFEDTEGRAVAVDGVAHVAVTLLNATGVDLSGREFRETYTGPGEIRPPDTAIVTEVQRVDDFEGSTRWVVGLAVPRDSVALTVTDAADPPRVVLTVGRTR